MVCSIFLTFVSTEKHIARNQGYFIPTKSFVKIGITKIFCYNNKMFLSSKRLVAATKNIFVVPNFVAVTKPFFSRDVSYCQTLLGYRMTGRILNVTCFLQLNFSYLKPYSLYAEERISLILNFLCLKIAFICYLKGNLY